jgi:toxin ParE1/3/4
MRKIRLLDEAVMDAMEAIDWYEGECTGLGVEFAEALDAALDLLEDEIVPLVSMPDEQNDSRLKRLVLARFPFDVVVIPYATDILIIAVAHHSRQPGYWTGRISSG